MFNFLYSFSTIYYDQFQANETKFLHDFFRTCLKMELLFLFSFCFFKPREGTGLVEFPVLSPGTQPRTSHLSYPKTSSNLKI